MHEAMMQVRRRSFAALAICGLLASASAQIPKPIEVGTKDQARKSPVESEKSAGMMLDRVDAERRRNQKTYEREYLPEQKRLHAKHRGKWIAIVSGKLLPRTKDGAIKPCSTLEELDGIARARFPKAKHRFVIRIGSEGAERWGLGMTRRRFTFGRSFLKGVVDNFQISYGSPSTFYIIDGKKRIRLPGAGPKHDLAPVVLAPFDHRPAKSKKKSPVQAQKQVPMLFTNLCEGTTLLGREAVQTLSPELWELPGKVRVDGLSRFGTLRRAWLRFRLPGTKYDFVQHVALWPAPGKTEIRREARKPKLGKRP